MNTNSLPLTIFFGTKSGKHSAGQSTRIKSYDKWSELSSAISQSPENIIFHIDLIKRQEGTVAEFMMMLETMIKYSNITVKPNFGVVINSDTQLATVKELLKHKILAIIPDIPEHIKNAVTSMLDGNCYCPREVIDKLPGNEQRVKNDHSLTVRQQEVFDLIARRGLSNKQIARVLNISESTVKIHVSAVMKNLCVRNRTQLALTK